MITPAMPKVYWFRSERILSYEHDEEYYVLADDT